MWKTWAIVFLCLAALETHYDQILVLIYLCVPTTLYSTGDAQ